MENKPKKQRSYLNLFIRRLLSMKEDKAPEEETIASIKAGIDFRGANLWILIFAIFVASLGLNTNSAAVIIGAMLISPLMGPIVGMGLGVGIYDFELLKRAFRSFATATIFSVLTATFYFAITPIDEAQSELLARTSPTIYDVLIALFGGLAGIVASSTRLKGNVIPGVAIATALMPPLCTAGFGIASGNLTYFFGAFYLYMINSVFIAFATTLGVKLMHFSKKTFVDPVRGKKVQQIVYTIIFVTMVPSIYITYNMIKTNIFETNANRFITNEINFPNTFVVNKHILQDSISVTLIGKEVPEDYLAILRQKLSQYKLEGTRLSVLQGLTQEKEKGQKDELDNMILQDFYKHNQNKVLRQENEIIRLRAQLNSYSNYDSLGLKITPEIKILFPKVETIGLSKMIRNRIATSQSDTLTVAILSYTQRLTPEEKQQLHAWLTTRLNVGKLEIVTENQ